MKHMSIKRLRKKLEKGWGKKCPDYDDGCAVCQIHKALDILEEQYSFIKRKRL